MNKQQFAVGNAATDTVVMDAAAHGQEQQSARFESAPVAGDQRRSYRYPAQLGRESATLQRSGRTWSAKLCEESAGGMALEISGKLSLQVNDEVEVGIYTGWYRARIVHLQPMEGGQRIGLQRISVISSEDDADGKPRRRDQLSAGMQVRNLIAVGLMAMALGVGTTSLYDQYFGLPDAHGGGNGIPIQYADRPPNDRLKGMLAGVNVLMEPEVADGLNLSKTQRQSIEGVMVGAANTLSEAYDESKDQPPDVWYGKSQEVVNRALENILCSLTDDQVIKWRTLMQYRRAGRDTSS